MTAVNEHPGIHHLPPSLRFPKGGWEVRWRNAEGASRRKTFETKKQALDFHRAKLTDVRRGTDHEESRKTFREVAEDWYAGLTDLKPKTIEGYKYTLDRHILPALGSKRIGLIRPAVLRAFLAGLPADLSPTTRRNIFRTVTPILNQALADGLIASNPAKLIKLPKAKAADKPSKSSMPTAEQVAALAETITPEYRVLVYFAAYTGMRAGEIVALRVRNLDLMRGRVTVEESVTAVATRFTDGTRLVTGTPKNGESRSFAIPRFLVEMVMEQVAGKGPDDFVFPGPSGGVLRHSWFFERHYRPDRLRHRQHGRCRPVPGARCRSGWRSRPPDNGRYTEAAAPHEGEGRPGRSKTVQTGGPMKEVRAAGRRNGMKSQSWALAVLAVIGLAASGCSNGGRAARVTPSVAASEGT
jgi:integrase